MRSRKMKPLFEPRPGHFWHLFGAKILPLSLKNAPEPGSSSLTSKSFAFARRNSALIGRNGNKKKITSIKKLENKKKKKRSRRGRTGK